MSSNRSRVLITGAFGTVGRHALPGLLGLGHKVTCLDVRTLSNERQQRDLLSRLGFDTVWVDLRQSRDVQQAVLAVQPGIIIHSAAIIPPWAYLHPQMAYEVNVGGTRNLISVARSLPLAPWFIYISSYSIHGPRNPYRDLPPLTASALADPGDNYAQHKVAGEQMVQNSGLHWTVLRLCGVMPLSFERSGLSEFLRLLFMLPVAQRQHGIDARDAGTAIANATTQLTADLGDRVFVIGGGEDWRVTSGPYLGNLFEAVGLGRLPDSAFRLPDPNVDRSWYYEDWADTSESQAILDYQNHSLADYLDDVRQQAGGLSMLARPLAPLIRRQLVRQSPFHGRDRLADGRSHWEAVCRVYGLDNRWLNATES